MCARAPPPGRVRAPPPAASTTSRPPAAARRLLRALGLPAVVVPPVAAVAVRLFSRSALLCGSQAFGSVRAGAGMDISREHHPHWVTWVSLGGLVLDGVAFVRGGGKRGAYAPLANVAESPKSPSKRDKEAPRKDGKREKRKGEKKDKHGKRDDKDKDKDKEKAKDKASRKSKKDKGSKAKPSPAEQAPQPPPTHESSPTPDVPAAEWSGNSAALGEERATGVHSSMAKVTVVRM